MDAALAAHWNETVGAEDEVWHLGDCAPKGAETEALPARLNGSKHLIRGNHDPPQSAGANAGCSTCPAVRRPPESECPFPTQRGRPIIPARGG